MSEINPVNFQFNSHLLVQQPIQQETIYVVIAKATRFCNADCYYCSSPPLTEKSLKEGEPMWDFATFKKYFDKVFPLMVEGSYWIWHGGEPMLMGPKFYLEAYDYALTQMKKI